MILNNSRVALFEDCPRRAFNQYVRGISTTPRIPLTVGAVFHKAVAHGLATKDWKTALEMVHTEGPAEIGPAVGNLPHEIENYVATTAAMVDLYQQAFAQQSFEVLQPECEFEVDIPNSYHNCVYLHHYDGDVEVWGPPNPESSIAGRIRPCVDVDCKCRVLHRIKGRTDAIVRFANNLWLLDHKTTAMLNFTWWKQWDLSKQISAYIYGVHRATNLRPRGMIISAIRKPTKAQVEGWNSKTKYGPPKRDLDYLTYERQLFLRTDEDLARWERQFVATANAWERNIISGEWNMHTNACTKYNNICDFHSGCLGHEGSAWLDSNYNREPDYINAAQQALLIQIQNKG